MKLPMVLIALPGTGKSTAIRSICETLLNPPSKIIDIDQIIKDRLKKDYLDPVVEKSLEKHPDKSNQIQVELKNNGCLSSTFFLETFPESFWRELEACFLLDILEDPNIGDAAIDLGGKMFFEPQAKECLLRKSFIPIFLYCDHLEILAHLSHEDNWKKRSNYRLAGPEGWSHLAEEHRIDRMPYMITHSRIIIDVTGLTPEQVGREILWSMKAYQLQQERSIKPLNGTNSISWSMRNLSSHASPCTSSSEEKVDVKLR